MLNTEPVQAVVELDTGNGAFRIYLALQCAWRKLRFVTYDRYVCANLAQSPLPVAQVIGDL